MNIMPHDEVAVEFAFKVSEVVHKEDPNKSIVWGHTVHGVYCCIPLSAVVEKFPELGNGGEEIPGTGEVRCEKK